MKPIISSLAASLALIANSVSAEEPSTANPTYEDAMRCSALHGFFMAITDQSQPAYAKHEEHATRWLGMAMVRDGEGGARAQQQYQPSLELLIKRANSMEDKPDELNEFLMFAFNKCTAMETANSPEFAAVEVD